MVRIPGRSSSPQLEGHHVVAQLCTRKFLFSKIHINRSIGGAVIKAVYMCGGSICRLSIDHHHGVQRYHPCTFPITDSSPGAQYNALLVASKFCTNRFYRCVRIVVALSNCDHNCSISSLHTVWQCAVVYSTYC